MTDAIEDIDQDILLEESPILQLIKKWKDKENASGFNAPEHLVGLSECIEHELTEFWGRDPDPFDERLPRKVPVAGVYGDICNDLIEQNEFILNLIVKYVITRSDDETSIKLTLRFLCSVLNCCSLSIITGFETDTKEQFYNKIFEWALSDKSPINVYSTYIAGHITNEDDQVIPHRKATLINLISRTMARLETLNKNSRDSMRQNWNIIRDNNFLLDEGSNASVRDMSMSQICGVWNLSTPMKEATQERLLIFFLRHIAGVETLMPSVYTSGVLPLMASWLRGDRHDDIRLTFEALRLLTKLLCHRVIYIEFYEHMDGINLLLSIPRPSVAANAISACLYNLVDYAEIADKVAQLPQQQLEHLMKVLLWIIETCHPSARSYGMLCVQCLLRQPLSLRLFERLHGPRYILNSLAVLPSMLGDSGAGGGPGPNSNRNARKDSTYFGLLKNTLNTMKVCLEQSLISWGSDPDNGPFITTTDTVAGLLAFPSETETPFQKRAVTCIPAAMRLQTWRHPYIADRSNIVRVLYSKAGFFEDAFSNFHEMINSTLDILSLLCVSNKFVVKFLDFSESDTKATIKMIFGILMRRPNSVSANHVKALKSILFFLGILCCRPLQGSRPSAQLNKSSARKRKFEDMDASTTTVEVAEKVHISENGVAIKISPVSAMAATTAVGAASATATSCTVTAATTSVPVGNKQPPPPPRTSNFHLELQTKLWNLIRCYNAIPKLLKILEVPLSPLDTVSVRTWVCHVLSGMSRCNDILLMLRKLPTFNKGIVENLMKEPVTPERMGEHAEFCTIARRLIRDLRGESGSVVDRAGDLRPDQIRKMEIVGRTQVQWDNRELLHLIYQHLQQSGFHDVADLLRQQANLPGDDRHNLSLYRDSPPCTSNGPPGGASDLHNLSFNASTGSGRLLPQTPKRTFENRLNILTSSTPKPIVSDTAIALRPKLYRDTVNQTSIMTKSMAPSAGKTTTLNEIVETFLRTQHAQCPNPISICPKFSLHTKHICPSVGDSDRPANILNYITKRGYDSTHHTINNRMLHRYVHRTFKPRVLLNESDVFTDDRFSDVFCFAKGLEDGLFFASENSGIVFTDVDLAQSSVDIGEVNNTTSNLENTKNGRLLMASSAFSRRNPGVLTLFNVENRCSDSTRMKKEHEYQFCGYSEFGKTNDTKFIITQDKNAQIIDVETGAVMHTCSNEDTIVSSVRNVANRATFSYDDNLVLSYGTLWDVRCSPREPPVVETFMHRFDNLEDIVSGVFHPNGLEVIIGSAVWDVRTYRLLQNIPTLKSSRIIFNEQGDFFYTYKDGYNSYASNPVARGQNIFQCFDSRDYSVVSTVNTNKVILSLAVDPKDLGVAVIESNDEGGMHAQCRVFSVGYQWSSSDDNDDDVDESDDEELNESDLEFVMDVDLNDFMYMSDSDDSSSDNHDVEGDDGDDDNDHYLSMSGSGGSSSSDLTSSYNNNELEDFIDTDDSISDESGSGSDNDYA